MQKGPLINRQFSVQLEWHVLLCAVGIVKICLPYKPKILHEKKSYELSINFSGPLVKNHIETLWIVKTYEAVI
jgi:hypothetical protein